MTSASINSHGEAAHTPRIIRLLYHEKASSACSSDSRTAEKQTNKQTNQKRKGNAMFSTAASIPRCSLRPVHVPRRSPSTQDACKTGPCQLIDPSPENLRRRNEAKSAGLWLLPLTRLWSAVRFQRSEAMIFSSHPSQVCLHFSPSGEAFLDMP